MSRFTTTTYYPKNNVLIMRKIFCSVCKKRFKTTRFKDWFTMSPFNAGQTYSELYKKVEERLNVRADEFASTYKCKSCGEV